MSDPEQLKLKYLELARDEILYRIKSANDTLIIYVGAIGAISAWFFNLYKDKGLPNPGETNPQFDFVLFRIGVVVSFLSLCASWIINHHERMIFALARYQKEELDLNNQQELDRDHRKPTLWEHSKSLKEGDTRSVSISVIVHIGLIVGPSGFVLYEMWTRRSNEWSSYCFSIASALTAVSLLFMLGTLRTWSKVKSSRQEKAQTSQTERDVSHMLCIIYGLIITGIGIYASIRLWLTKTSKEDFSYFLIATIVALVSLAFVATMFWRKRQKLLKIH